MDEEQELIRKFDPNSSEFQSSSSGVVIKSKRKFGVEIEMVSPDSDMIRELSSSISSSFGFDTDGSIQTKSGHGIEVVSPILSGLAGENAIVKLFKEINLLKFKVNSSCGLHVHLDGDGFKNSKKTEVLQLSETGEIDATGAELFVVSRGVLKMITQLTGQDESEIVDILSDEYLSTGEKHLYPSKTFGMRIPDLTVRNSYIQIAGDVYFVDMYDFADKLRLVNGEGTFSTSELLPKHDDYLCMTHANKALENTKTLLYLYSAYNDVFMSMLAQSRRINMYCQSLSMAFAPNQIETINSYTDLEKEWYKTRNMIETASRKSGHYDDSRYYGVNLHSLFTKLGTVEIRSHSATLSHEKVLYWVALHQAILDGIVKGRITIEGLRNGLYITKPQDRLEYLLRTLKLNSPIEKYVRQRISFFENTYK